ncbi:MAG: hypothetical protein E6R04_07230 [Spirochaetes bacterium]|nr:MAG: hypothetical protein E6R04_07230 [Spirochaetota bacterium]
MPKADKWGFLKAKLVDKIRHLEAKLEVEENSEAYCQMIDEQQSLMSVLRMMSTLDGCQILPSPASIFFD